MCHLCENLAHKCKYDLFKKKVHHMFIICVLPWFVLNEEEQLMI
jgi:hypothetical protein